MMCMKSYFLVLVFSGVCLSQDAAKYQFHIPAYSGTGLFKPPSDGGWGLNLPFATVLKVFRTRDGSSLDKEAVIRFYERYFTSKGWRSGVDQRVSDEPFLSLRIDLFEHRPDGVHIQVAGEFHLWVAPRDGMYTILCEQWRISTENGPTRALAVCIRDSLKSIARQMSINSTDIFYDSGWEKAYENEFLLSRSMFTLEDSAGHSVTAAIQTYRDSTTAQNEVRRILDPFGSPEEMDSLGQRAIEEGRLVPVGLEPQTLAVSFSNCVLIMEPYCDTDRPVMLKLYEQLKKVIQ